MKLKLKHLRHPLRAAAAAKTQLAARWNMYACAELGKRRFRGDARYDLRNITDGFAPRPQTGCDDRALLERICTAYIKAMRQEPLASPTYRATGWWEQVRRENLKPVVQALNNRDFAALESMYGNFFRDSCSAGLIGVPWNGTLHGNNSSKIYRRFYLSDVLHRVEYWKQQTEGRFPLGDLDGPPVGNPFGALIEETLLRNGSEYHHYCAHRVIDLLATRSTSGRASVVEIGGGFGDMAWYLLRDLPNLTYINFDVPESIALASYYLLKSFPNLRFLLYGENELTKDAIAGADIVLMPAFELAVMPATSADFTFCSHVMSDISFAAMAEYLGNISRITRDGFLFVGSSRAADSISALQGRGNSLFMPAEKRSSNWHGHRASKWDEVECLLRTARIGKLERQTELVET
jgi:hypothetical protein